MARSLPLLVAAFAAFSAPQDGVPTWPLDVRGVARPLPAVDGAVDLRLPLAASLLDRLDDRRPLAVEGEVPRQPPDWGEFLGVLAPRYAGELYVRGARGEREGVLSVEGPAAARPLLEEALAELEHDAARVVPVELWSLPSTPSGMATTDGVLSAEQATAVLEAARPSGARRVGTARAVPGRAEALGSATGRQCLTDYDVEVAERAAVYDPQVIVVPSGARCAVVVGECLDGSYDVRLWGWQAVDVSERDAALGVPALALPSVASMLLAGSGRVAPGGALVVGAVRGAGPSVLAPGAWLLRVGRPDAADGPARLLPLGGLARATLRVPIPWLTGPSPSGGWAEPDEWSVPELAAEPEPWWDEFALQDALWEAFPAGLGDGERAGAPWALLPGGLLVADREQREAVRERLAAWERPHASGVRIELRWMRDAAAFESADAVAEDAPHGLVLCAGDDDCALAAVGRERILLSDYDVEIASASRAADPIVTCTFRGVSFWCRPSPQRDGRCALDVDLRLSDTLELREGEAELRWLDVAPDGEDGRRAATVEGITRAPLQLERAWEAGLRTRLVVEDGEWTEVLRAAVDPGGATDDEVAVVLRARRYGPR